MITIIVLLILAGVTIATLTGDNGVITKANHSKTETMKVGAKEKVQIAVMGSYDSNGKLSETTLKNNLSKIEGVSDISQTEGYPITLTIDDTKLKLTEDGIVTEEFNVQKWDELATAEDCFLWEDTTIIGLNMDKLSGVEKIIIPSKCTKIRSDYSHSWPNDNEIYRDFVTGIKIVEIPETVVEIGDYAFLNFKQLEEIKIPNSVKKIGNWAFSWCTSLQEVNIPDSVEYIGNSAFNSSSNLKRVKLSNNLNQIPDGIFYDCSKIENIVIPDKVTEIQTRSFYGCDNLVSVIIPENVTEIAYYAFGKCENLIKITIPSSITSINSNAFGESRNLVNINIKKPENSISGSPWGASNATVTWNYTRD